MDTMAPTRPALRRTRRILLTAGPDAAAKARRHVRAALYAWDVPVEPTIAALLTSELVTNAIRHEAGETVMLAISCACGRFRVTVHDTSSLVSAGVRLAQPLRACRCFERGPRRMPCARNMACSRATSAAAPSEE